MNYLVIGYSLSGKSATKLLAKKGHRVFVYDDKVEILGDLPLGAIKLPQVDDQVLKVIDTCVISPGVKFSSPVMQKIKEKQIKIIGELELGYSYIKGKLLAITGTNGKTTAVSLLNHIIGDCALVGNVGNPITSHIQAKKLVCEVSSFQLCSIDTFRPKIAGITYIDSDHLDYHSSTEEYIEAKYNIAKNMTKKDFLVLNADDPISMKLAFLTKAKVYTFSTKGVCRGTFVRDGKIYFIKKYKEEYIMDVSSIKLLGEHNIANVLLVITMAKLFGIKSKVIKQKIESFEGLQHRLQVVSKIDGVTYINDSKATNISATKVALNAVGEKCILLVGGSDKGYEYDELIKDLSVKKLIVFGAVKQKLIDACSRCNYDNYLEADNLYFAVSLAKVMAIEGDTGLLSPASASFDEFINYEERGRKFEEYVKDKD